MARTWLSRQPTSLLGLGQHPRPVRTALDGETSLPPDPHLTDLPPLRPWWGPSTARTVHPLQPGTTLRCHLGDRLLPVRHGSRTVGCGPNLRSLTLPSSPNSDSTIHMSAQRAPRIAGIDNAQLHPSKSDTRTWAREQSGRNGGQVRADPEPGGPGQLGRAEKVMARVVACCDVVLIGLSTWQAVDGMKPATMIATGLVRVVRLAASWRSKQRRS